MGGALMRVYNYQRVYSVYSYQVDDRLFSQEYPKIALAVGVVRQHLGFRGSVKIKKLSRGTLGRATYDGSSMTVDPSVEEMLSAKIMEIVTHEAIHSLGVRHMENFRSHGGRRCENGMDHLSHWVARILRGEETFAKMLWRFKNIGAHSRLLIGAHSRLLLRQIVRVEAAARQQRKIENAFGGCVGLVDLYDGRAVRWKQMTPEQRAKQVSAMYRGRMEKRFGYIFWSDSNGRRVDGQ